MNVKLMKNFAPNIYINIDALNKMKEYVRQSSLEIGWLGTCEKEGNSYFITDVFLFKQEVHATTTEITTEGLNDFAMDILQDPNGVEIWNNMKVWGHSHVNMSTSPSGQDDKQIEVFAENADDFFIRIIANKQNDFRIDLYDFLTGVIYEKLPYTVDFGEDTNYINALYKKISELNGLIKAKSDVSNEVVNSIKSEISEKVKEKKFQMFNTLKTDSYTSGYSCGYTNNYFKDFEKNYTKKKEKKTKVEEVFGSLSKEDIFETTYYLEYGAAIQDLISTPLTYEELDELQKLIEDYSFTHMEEYDEYLGYTI